MNVKDATNVPSSPQTFYNGDLQLILHQLLVGVKGSGNGSSQPAFPSKGVCVRRIPVPPDFFDRTYGELMAHFVRTEKQLCLGLYRQGEGDTGVFPYVSEGCFF